MNESQTRAQQKYRSKPEIRAKYLADAKRRSKAWYANPENRIRRYKYNQEWWLKRIKELEEIAGRPRPEKCEICKNDREKICFDHDHKTGKFRGWICVKCNTILGKVKDSPKLLQSLIDYLNVK
jgi:hypothetical protein